MKPDIKKKISESNPKKVKHLALDNGRLKEIPFELEQFTNLTFLNLFNNNLKEIPDFFQDYPKLDNLNLSNNNFDLLPEQITHIKSLKNLNLSSNRLTHLFGLERLYTNLEKLDLSSNKLTLLNCSFEKFAHLRELNLSNNGLKKFPKSLFSSNLKLLNLSSNKLKTIPNSIGKLEKLRELDLSYNDITEIPEEICELKELRKLILTGNNIQSLPKSLKKLTHLNTLTLAGNPIGDVPLEISSQGLKGVLNYYLHLGAYVKLNEAKLLIVGQGAVGKTYLMNKMISGSSPETNTTEGIDIVKWTISDNNQNPNNQIFRLNAWDFGGQEIYHSTHQFFLTKRSIYLFVWEARKDENMLTFDYWLNIINVLSNASPVIVVLNKIDERVKEIDEKSLKEKFTNIAAFKKVSAKDGTNLNDLISEIKKEVVTLPHIGDKLPKVWSEIREELENLEDDYILYEQYIEICHRFGLNKNESKILSQYYHDLGVFLHFTDSQVLRSIVFLKPEWATNCVYKILDLHQVVTNYGEFDSDLLDKELLDYSATQIAYIIELMKKFELCFELSNGKYIVPELLRPSSPIVDWDMKGSISLIYQYDFMPAGILPRLIVRLKDLIYDQNYWKSGVYIFKDDALGVVISNPFSRYIKIEVSGNSNAILLGIIKRELDYINSTLNYPHHEIKIQCNCQICYNSDEPFMFNYEYLERAKKAKVDTVQCNLSIENINLEKLIGPYQISQYEGKSDFRFNTVDLTYDLYEISSRILERKYTRQIEDLITDYFTDNLRSKGYQVTDQSRSGKSKKLSGELDIVIRNTRNMPVAILEAMKLNSIGMGNKTVIEHINKLLIDYDTNGLNRNFILVYVKTSEFSTFWQRYRKYIEKLPDHYLYKPEAELTSFRIDNEVSNSSNVKVLVSEHSRNGKRTELFHYVINMG